MRAPMTIWISPKTRMMMRRLISERAGAGRGGVAALRPHRLLARWTVGVLGDDRLVDLIDGHGFDLCLSR